MFDALQRTSAFILNGPSDFVDEMRAIYRRRRDLLADALVRGCECAQAQGGPSTCGSRYPKATRRPASASTCLSRRPWWTPGPLRSRARGFVRLSLTTPDDRIAEAIARIKTPLTL